MAAHKQMKTTEAYYILSSKGRRTGTAPLTHPRPAKKLNEKPRR